MCVCVCVCVYKREGEPTLGTFHNFLDILGNFSGPLE